MDSTEKELLELKKEKEQVDKRLLISATVLEIISMVSFFVLLFVAIYAIVELKLNVVVPILLIVLATAILIAGALICFWIEQKAGYYQCAKCRHKYVPTYSQSVFAPHLGRTKYMKCPRCNKRSWNKKVISK